MSAFESGQEVQVNGGPLATFVKLIAPDQAIIRIGFDTQVVNPVSLTASRR